MATERAARVIGPSPATIRAALRRRARWTVAEWRELRREWSRQLRECPAGDVIRLAQALVQDGGWARQTAYELVAYHPTALSALTPGALCRLARGIADWGAADTFACLVAGVAWREGRLPTRQIHAWLRSTDRWQRRVAVVSTVALNVRARGGRGDVARTLAVCQRAVADRDDMVVKALSWALRSLVEWDRAGVAAFLDEQGAALAGRVTREVRSKLRTGRKN
jgi:3-methyladenine DNA glycosylase AlkD